MTTTENCHLTSQVSLPAAKSNVSAPFGINKIYCNICDVHCFGEFSYKSHLKGKKHLKRSNGKKTQKVIPKELRNDTITDPKGFAIEENISTNTQNKQDMATIEQRAVKKASLSLKRGLKASTRRGNFHSYETNGNKYAQKNYNQNRIGNINEQNFSSRHENKWNHYSSHYNNAGFHNSFNYRHGSNYQNYNRSDYNQYNWRNNRKNYYGWNDTSRNYPSASSGTYRSEGYEKEYPEFYSNYNVEGNANWHKTYDDAEIDATNNTTEKNVSDLNEKSKKNVNAKCLNANITSEEDSTSTKVLLGPKRLSKDKTSREHFPSHNSSVIRPLNSPTMSSSEKGALTCNSSLNYVDSADKLENVSTSDCDKQQDKRILSENMTDRIAHWINPLNSRDKAEVDKLMTEFSKSKKKENLLKLKHRAENELSNDEDESLFQKVEQLQDKTNTSNLEFVQNECNPLNLVEQNLSSIKVSQDNNSREQFVIISPKEGKRKKSSLSESGLILYDINADTVMSNSTKSPLSRSNSLSESGYLPEKLSCKSNKKVRSRARKSRDSTDSTVSTQKRTLVNKQLETDSEDVFRKRRNSFSQISKTKKHKCSASECSEQCSHEILKKQHSSLLLPDPQMQITSTENENMEIYNELYQDSRICVKQELSSFGTGIEVSGELTPGNSINEQDTFSSIISENAPILDVDDLMKVFAAQNVTIKKEFDDPLIDAIKNVDINFLLNVCDQQTVAQTEVSAPVTQTEVSVPVTQTEVSVPVTQTEVSIPVIQTEVPVTQSTEVSIPVKQTEVSVPVTHEQTPTANSETVKYDQHTNLVQSNSSKILPKTETFETTFTDLSPYNVYVNISNELKKLQKEEESKRTALKDIDKEINKYQKILSELAARKIKLQTEEDNLISRRNGLTCALSQCIIREPCSVSDYKKYVPTTTSDVKSADSTGTNNSLIELVSQFPNITDISTLFNSPSHSMSFQENNVEMCSPYKSVENKMESTRGDNEEIILIEQPNKMKSAEIPVIDIDCDSPVKYASITTSKDKNKENYNTEPVQSFFEMKSLTAHQTVVNSLKVFNDYLYTCSNDYTAKRFDLKDPSQIVTYKNLKRNVLQLCIEKYNDCSTFSTLVFTLCSLDELISAFTAEDGILVKTYKFDYIVAGICNGKEKVFAGLQNGLVMVCNWKETKDLTRNLEPIKNIASTFQGGLHLLIILSTNGQVSVRDVERSGLLIRYIKPHAKPLFMDVYNNYVYLSSSIILTAADLSSGNMENRIKLTSPITGLAAYENYIFTTSFSGLVRCYSDGKEEEVKTAYGAGNNALTCICVNNGWVFTGNRNGEVAVLKFDPHTEYRCQYGNCRYVFTRLEDLERHIFFGVEHTLSKNSKCQWKGCKVSFKVNWQEEAKQSHLKEHIQNACKFL